MNRCDKTIVWADKSWSPLSGCYGPGGSAEHPHVCSYCYASRIATRFAGSKSFPNGFAPTWHPERLDEPLKLRKPSRIFVGSMTDMFGSWVASYLLARVLEVIATCPQHTFYTLTKQPQNIMEALFGATEMLTRDEKLDTNLVGRLKQNLWLGTSVDTQARADAALHPMFDVARAGWHVFASIEPLLTAIRPVTLAWAEWQIIGAQTGPGAAKHRPEREWVTHLMNVAVGRVPVFLKDSITKLWPDLQRREWPQ